MQGEFFFAVTQITRLNQIRKVDSSAPHLSPIYRRICRA